MMGLRNTVYESGIESRLGRQSVVEHLGAIKSSRLIYRLFLRELEGNQRACRKHSQRT